MASKTGYLYVFDRVTGQPIWPIEERPVPRKTTVPGEELWPTQPFPTAPPPFARQKFGVDDLNPYILTPEEREQFRQRILKARNEGPRSSQLAPTAATIPRDRVRSPKSVSTIIGRSSRTNWPA